MSSILLFNDLDVSADVAIQLSKEAREKNNIHKRTTTTKNTLIRENIKMGVSWKWKRECGVEWSGVKRTSQPIYLEVCFEEKC
jgi:hypothetical protein